MEGIISGSQEFEILMPPFHIWEKLKVILKEAGPLTYERNYEVELALENIEVNNIPVGKYLNLVLI